MTPHRPLSEHEYAALSLLLHGAPIVFSDVPARNGTDVIGGPIPGRKTWQSLINAGLVLDPTEDPIQLDDGELFSFTPYLEITDLGRQAFRSGCIPPAADRSKPSDPDDPAP